MAKSAWYASDDLLHAGATPKTPTSFARLSGSSAHFRATDGCHGQTIVSQRQSARCTAYLPPDRQAGIEPAVDAQEHKLGRAQHALGRRDLEDESAPRRASPP